MTTVARTARGVLLAGTEAAVFFDALSGRATIDANLMRPSADYLEFGTPVVHLVQYLLGFGRWRMTQTQMTAHLADKIGITKRQAKSALDELNELVVKQLKKEGLLRLAGLGVFRKRKLKARMGRNPATGEQIKIPARTRLRFTPAKALKDSVLGAR